MADMEQLRRLVLEALDRRGWSSRDAQREIGLGRQTIANIVNGRHTGVFGDDTLDKLLVLLNTDRATLFRLGIGDPTADLGRWVPPPMSARLSLRQRRALEALIDSIVAPDYGQRADHVKAPAGNPSNQTVTSGLPDSGGNIGTPDAGGRRTARPPRRSGRSAVERHLEDAREPGARRDRASDGRT